MDNNDFKMSQRRFPVATLSNKMYDAISLRREPEYVYFEM